MRAYLLFVIGVDGLAIRLPRDTQVIQLDPGTDSLFGWTWDFLSVQPSLHGAGRNSEKLRSINGCQIKAQQVLRKFRVSHNFTYQMTLRDKICDSMSGVNGQDVEER
jgi:hypothetical protein